MNLKAILPLAIFLAGLASETKAQAFERGAITASGGYGFGNVLGAFFTTYSTYDSYELKTIRPIFVKGEYGISKRIGLGINIAYNRYHASFRNDSLDYYYDVIYANTSFLVRFNAHFLDHDKADLYYGIGLGYRMGGWSFKSNDELFDVRRRTALPIGMESTLGFRYMYSENIGAYLEVGMAKGLVQFGVVGQF